MAAVIKLYHTAAIAVFFGSKCDTAVVAKICCNRDAPRFSR